jgi:hypothetical protein
VAYAKVCPNCDERFPRWRRFCRYHRWKVRLLTVERKAELDADLASELRGRSKAQQIAGERQSRKSKQT